MFTLLEFCNYDVRIRQNGSVWMLPGRHYTLLCVASVVGVSDSSLQRSLHAVLANDGAFTVSFTL